MNQEHILRFVSLGELGGDTNTPTSESGQLNSEPLQHDIVCSLTTTELQ
jgi:hypothetical protein